MQSQEEIKTLTYDEVLAAAGGFGRYQGIVYVAVCLLRFTAMWDVATYVFISFTPTHCCHRPPDTPSIQINSCPNDANVTCTSRDYPADACPSGWQYDRTYFTSTTVTDWDLICARAWWPGFAQTLFMSGATIGTLLMGATADIWGRRPIMILLMSLNFLSYILTTCSQNVYMFSVSRFLTGFTTFPMMTISGNLILELVSKEWRLMAGMATWYFWCAGTTVLAGVASLATSWRHLLAVQTVVEGLVYIYSTCTLPESPRWLTRRGRHDEATKLLRTMANTNHRQLPDHLHVAEEDSEAAGATHLESRAPPLSSLIHYPRLIARTMALCVIWFTGELCYYLMTYLVSNISGNVYGHYAISGVLDVVGMAFMHVLLKFCGRRWPISAFMLCSALTFFIHQLLLLSPADLSSVQAALILIGKVASNCAVSTLFFYTGEVYPTVIRNLGVGMCATMGRLGAVIAPLLVVPRVTASREASSSIIACGVAAVLAAILALALPETSNTRLPETLGDGEQLGKAPAQGEIIPLTAASGEVGIWTKGAMAAPVAELKGASPGGRGPPEMSER